MQRRLSEPAPSKYLKTPPRFFARYYLVNHHWKSATVKTIANVYLWVIARLLFISCDPWYTYFKYLTVWGWTLIQIYFAYTLYLDLWSRFGGRISPVAKVTAQTIGEMAFAINLVVTILFWFAVYPHEPWRRIIWEVNMHGMGLIIMIFDYLYRFAGFRLRSLPMLYAFGASYTITHVICVLVSGTPIYPGITFRNAYSFIIFTIGLSSIVITHKVFYLIHNWARLKEEWKTVLGISAFFLVPRKQSADVLDFMSEFMPEVTDENDPTRMSPRSDTDVVTKRKQIGFTSRLSSFAIKEVLSVSPSESALRAIQRRTKT